MMKKLIDVPTIPPNSSLSKIRNILKKMVKNDEIYTLISDFYQMKISLDNGGNSQLFLENYYQQENYSPSKKGKLYIYDLNYKEIYTIKKYGLSSLDNIFTKFLYLLNASFDGESSLDETEFLSKILKREDIIKILTRQDLNLKLRTELIKFYRMLYIDIIIDKNKEIFYNSLIIKPIIIESDFGDRLNNKDYYKLISDIVKVKDCSTYENLDYALFMFEFQNFTKFLENYNDLNDDKIWKYIADI